MSNLHTPGPWRVTSPDRVYNGEVIKHGDDWIAVLSDFNRVDRDAEREANARLIAATPDLFEALEAVEQGLLDGSIRFTRRRQAESDPYHPANTLMSRALAKARPSVEPEGGGV